MRGDQLAKSGTEHGHQRAFFAELRIWSAVVADHTFAIPNGGSRGDTELSRKIRGNTLKMEGVKAGVPDVFVAWPFRGTNALWAGLFIEMKRPEDKEKDRRAGTLGKNQDPWHERLRRNGYKVEVCYTWQEALEAVWTYFEISYDRAGHP